MATVSCCVLSAGGLSKVLAVFSFCVFVFHLSVIALLLACSCLFFGGKNGLKVYDAGENYLELV